MHERRAGRKRHVSVCICTAATAATRKVFVSIAWLAVIPTIIDGHAFADVLQDIHAVFVPVH